MGQKQSSINFEVRTADGRIRTALVIIPDGGIAPPSGWPLVVMLHGAGGSTKHICESTRWDKLAKSEGFVVVFPNGTAANESQPESFMLNRQTWNSGQGGGTLASGQLSASTKCVDDVNFIDVLINEVVQRNTIDPRRIFIAGHSNGGAMAYRFASENPQRIAAIGIMGGHLQVKLGLLACPVSLISIVGDQDPFAPLEGGVAGTRKAQYITRPQRVHVAEWAQANKLSNSFSEIPQPIRDDERIKEIRWGPDTSGTEVCWFTIKNHGHSWAGTKIERLPSWLMGPQSNIVDATIEMWKFFKNHPKQQLKFQLD